MDPIRFRVSAHHGKLQIEFQQYPEGFAFFVEVSASKHDTYTFILPYATNQCALDIGPGSWTTRVGIMTGEPIHGTVTWSMYADPVMIETEKSRLPSIKHTFEITKLLYIEGGIRMYSTIAPYSYCIVEVWKVDETPNLAQWYYYYTFDQSYIDIKYLQYTYHYNIRIRTVDSIPRNDLVQLSSGYLLERKTAITPNRYLDTTEQASRAAGQAMLNQTSRMKFHSHADYVRYQATLAKASLK
jgi:hypothetical protein